MSHILLVVQGGEANHAREHLVGRALEDGRRDVVHLLLRDADRDGHRVSTTKTQQPPGPTTWTAVLVPPSACVRPSARMFERSGRPKMRQRPVTETSSRHRARAANHR
eukprot:scaffold9632_cov36-Phaeocystis_antarctica.AAC.1